MTMPHERTRAVIHAREFLEALMDREATPGVTDDIRRQARVLLRHYPSASDMELAHKACPMWFGSPKDVT